MPAELTDDLGLSPEFADGYSDYDPMYEGPGDGPKCGGCCLDHDGRFIGPGCRHCNPPDHEAKPYGFGIETFDNGPRLRLQQELRVTAWFTGLTWDQVNRCATDWSGFSRRRLRHSNIVWDRLCDECETHTEATEAYVRWAIQAVQVRYRDEPRPETINLTLTEAAAA